MKKRYIPGLIVGVATLGLATFVVVDGMSDKANTKVIKGAVSSQDSGLSSATTTAREPRETPAPSVSDPAGAIASEKADIAVPAAGTTAETAHTLTWRAPAGQDKSYAASGGHASDKGHVSPVARHDNSNYYAVATKPVQATAPAPVAPAPTSAPATDSPASTPAPAPKPAVVPAADAKNLVLNPSAEDAVAGKPMHWTFGGYGNNTATSAHYDTGYASDHSLRLDISNYTDGDAKWISDEITVTPGKTYVVSNRYKSVGMSQVNAAYITDGRIVSYAWLGDAAAQADWAQFSGHFTVPAGISSVVLFHALTSDGSLSTDDYSIVESDAAAAPVPAPTPVTTPLPVPAPAPTPVTAPLPSSGNGFSSPLVSLTFDDGWKSIHDNALPVMSQYGITSTQYLNSQPIEENFASYMSPQDVRDFYNAGHELGWHTRTHSHLPLLGTADVDTELTIPQTFLGLIGVGPGAFTNFASPFGETTPAIVDQIRAHGFTHRSVEEGFNTKANLNLNNIVVQNILNTTTLAQFQGWVNQAVADGSWLVLVYHEVSDTPTDPDPTYTIGTAAFQAEMAYLAGVRDAGSVKVLTQQQAINEIMPQLGQ
ncbi:MAG TPA: polysaccharide deacetylase family protein [Candidatus Saccharimonadales bacterium]|jgi:peptidoglycan/xylan/chitin deacetylase (PgdA/CDA1 family)